MKGMQQEEEEIVQERITLIKSKKQNVLEILDGISTAREMERLHPNLLRCRLWRMHGIEFH